MPQRRPAVHALRQGFLSGHGSRLIPVFLALNYGAVAHAEVERTIDLADSRQSGQWVRHPVCGDVSYDAFVHADSNPVYRGAPPYEWPVNGSLFRDPLGGGWYLYVGHYRANYAIEPSTPCRCTVFRSRDEGRSWEDLGPVFTGPAPTYKGEVSPTIHIPDVMVLYADGRYHMCFDWCTRSTTWANASNPGSDANSGVGYAWADRPEGPFHITARPIATTRSQPLLLGKYRRLYISTLVRREHDWLVLTDSDSGPHYGWALLGMTAMRPEGPYGPAKLLLNPEAPRFHPPLVEFNPAFTHSGFIYMPATSVAANRDYQALFRAPIEEAMSPESWTLVQQGSLWHSDGVEHETYGIWGQTFSGFVSPNGVLNVFFPSRDSRGMGAVNVASRPWAEPLRPKGFVVSAHDAPSLSYLKFGGRLGRVEAEIERSGTVALIWNAEGILGTAAVEGPWTIHPRGLCSFSALELGPNEWRLVQVNAAGESHALASGPLGSSPAVRFSLTWEDEEAVLSLEGRAACRAESRNGPGNIGIMCQRHSRAEVTKLALTGRFEPARVRYLCTDAILGAAREASEWPVQQDRTFRYGFGAVSVGSQVEAKWNFEGTQFALWAPKGPRFGTVELVLDGRDAGAVDLHAESQTVSSPVYRMDALSADGGHALILRTDSRPVPLDVLETSLEGTALGKIGTQPSP